MPHCAVIWCNNQSKNVNKQNSGVSYHKRGANWLMRATGTVLCLICMVMWLEFHGHYNYEAIPEHNIKSMLLENPEKTDDKDLLKCRPNFLHATTISQLDLPAIDFSSDGIISGEYIPSHCHPVFSTAIIVPYRARSENLDIFLKYMHNFLRRQDIHYRIFVVEQTEARPFNRGKLLNIGVAAAIQEHFPCIILHDVDLLPLNDRNPYVCLKAPRHMSAVLDKFRFVLPYSTLTGGVLAISATDFTLVDGFSNNFWGWGGEDDEIARRLIETGIRPVRLSRNRSEYMMLPHKLQSKVNRHARLRRVSRDVGDGYIELQYKLLRFERRPLYTSLLVEV